MPAPSVLVVEDDVAIRRLVSAHLKSNGFNVIEAWSIVSASRLLCIKHFDAMILDLELEDGEGYELLKDKMVSDIMTLVVSAREQVVDRIISFELGADDYLTKPIDLRELVMRLRRSLTRGAVKKKGAAAEPMLDIDARLKLNIVERTIIEGDRTICRLSSRELKLLCLFIKNPSVALSRDKIAREVMGHAFSAESRVVDVLVSDLRLKLQAAQAAAQLKNVRGEGYVMGMEHR